MKVVVFSALVLAVAGCGSASKQESGANNPAASAPAAPAKEVAPPVVNENPKFSCTKGKETRILEVVKKDNGCVFAYTKEGKMSDAASSTHGMKHCQKSQEKVRARLEKAGFECTT